MSLYIAIPLLWYLVGLFSVSVLDRKYYKEDVTVGNWLKYSLLGFVYFAFLMGEVAKSVFAFGFMDGKLHK